MMPTHDVSLTDDQARFVESLVESGRYQNTSDVLRDGLRLIEERDAERAAKLDTLRAAVQVGIDDLDAGRYMTFDDPDALDAHLTKIADRAIGRSTRR